jgi:vesicle-associated membrane protein 7
MAENDNKEDYKRLRDQKIEEIQQNVRDTKAITQQNVESLLERGEKIETLVDKTEALSNQGTQFRHNTRKLRWEMCQRNAKCIGISVIIMIIIIVVVVLSVCVGHNCWGRGK